MVSFQKSRLETSQKWEFLIDDKNPGWIKIKNFESGQYLAASTYPVTVNGNHLSKCKIV
jgi:hypothetical protein